MPSFSRIADTSAVLMPSLMVSLYVLTLSVFVSELLIVYGIVECL